MDDEFEDLEDSPEEEEEKGTRIEKPSGLHCDGCGSIFPVNKLSFREDGSRLCSSCNTPDLFNVDLGY